MAQIRCMAPGEGLGFGVNMKTVAAEAPRPAKPPMRQPHGRLSVARLGGLAERMVASNVPVERAEPREATVCGFHGDKSHAF